MTDNKSSHNKSNKQIEELKATVASLEKKLHEDEEIAKGAQADYIRFKMDMDGYMKRAQATKEKAELDALVDTAKELLPVINQLKQTVDNMPDDLSDHPRAQGVELTYKKAMSELTSLGIQQITAEIGQEPDLTYHIPISTEPTKEKKLHGKITQITETGYYYQDGGQQRVILPSKIIVGKVA